MEFQTTIKNPVHLIGTGLHSGVSTSVTLRPATANSGIVFHRVDLAGRPSIEATTAHVVNTKLSTTIGKDDATVATIEHLMAALYGSGIGNVHIDISGPEVPIMDGSARPFLDAIIAAGKITLFRPRKCFLIKKPITVRQADKLASITPSSCFSISSSIRFDHPAIADQSKSVTVTGDVFAGDISSARTFGFLKEVEQLKAHGLARGGSLDNAVVIGDEGVINPEGLRYEDEFVRHKILDAIGDLALAGHPIVGHVKLHKSGHDLHHLLLRELYTRKECWELTEVHTVEPKAPSFPVHFPYFAWMKA